jgi:GntR family transcriptional regulator/MocR family aminotransferase
VLVGAALLGALLIALDRPRTVAAYAQDHTAFLLGAETIAALAELLPSAQCRGAAAGLHVYLTLPSHVDEDALVRSAYDRGVGLERGAWHWAGRPPAPSLVLGFGSVSEAAIRQGIDVIAALIGDR